MLGSIQCLQNGKELWLIATTVEKVTLAVQTRERNVTAVITGVHLLKNWRPRPDLDGSV